MQGMEGVVRCLLGAAALAAVRDAEGKTPRDLAKTGRIRIALDAHLASARAAAPQPLHGDGGGGGGFVAQLVSLFGIPPKALRPFS